MLLKLKAQKRNMEISPSWFYLLLVYHSGELFLWCLKLVHCVKVMENNTLIKAVECSLLGTDSVRKQITLHICASKGVVFHVYY